MRDFYDDEDHDSEEDTEEEMEKEMESLFESMGLQSEAEAVVEIANIGLFKSDLRFRILRATIKMLEKSFFWKFRSPEWKRAAIKRAFIDFEGLLRIDED